MASRDAAAGPDDIPRIARPPSWTPDWSAASVDRRRSMLGELEKRFRALAPRTEVPAEVDRRLLGSALARVRWELDTHPVWRRSPAFWVDQALASPHWMGVQLPADAGESRAEQASIDLGRHLGTRLARRSASPARPAVLQPGGRRSPPTSPRPSLRRPRSADVVRTRGLRLCSPSPEVFPSYYRHPCAQRQRDPWPPWIVSHKPCRGPVLCAGEARRAAACTKRRIA